MVIVIWCIKEEYRILSIKKWCQWDKSALVFITEPMFVMGYNITYIKITDVKI